MPHSNVTCLTNVTCLIQMSHVSLTCHESPSYVTCLIRMSRDSHTWLIDTWHGSWRGDVRRHVLMWGDVTAWYVTWLKDINRIGSAGRACLVPRSAQTTGIDLLISLFAGGGQQVGAGQKASRGTVSQGTVCATPQGRAKRVYFIKKSLGSHGQDRISDVCRYEWWRDAMYNMWCMTCYVWQEMWHLMWHLMWHEMKRALYVIKKEICPLQI